MGGNQKEDGVSNLRTLRNAQSGERGGAERQMRSLHASDWTERLSNVVIVLALFKKCRRLQAGLYRSPFAC